MWLLSFCPWMFFKHWRWFIIANIFKDVFRELFWSLCFFLMLDLLCFTIVWHIWLLQTHHMLDYPVFHYPSLHWWKKHAIVMTGYILIVYGVNVYSQHFTGQQHLHTQMLFQWKIRMSTHQSVEYCWHLQDRINLVFFNGCSWRKHVGVLSCEISVEYWYFHHIWVSVLSLMY